MVSVTRSITRHFLYLLLCCNIAFASPGDIVFVTQVPDHEDFMTVVSSFGNHEATVKAAPRGGDLFVRYADGTLKNITAVAGFGSNGQQGANSIAVRDPAVHWSGNKVVFSMVIGSPIQQYRGITSYWQLYEVTGLGRNETPIITKVAHQPANYNNLMPTYGTDDNIIFVSDRPRNGAPHLYPQLDEYESKTTNTGLWNLNSSTGALFQMDHAPSGAFHPLVDSFGRVIYTRWDHLQRDQQILSKDFDYGMFNYTSELATATSTGTKTEIFPETIDRREKTTHQNFLPFNQFFPWQINEDGTEHETINHIGRHEISDYFEAAFLDDPNLLEFSPDGRYNPQSVDNFFHLREDPLSPGTYYAIDAPEFKTHAAGALFKFSAAPSIPADRIRLSLVGTAGKFRTPLPTSTGLLIASHTNTNEDDANIGTSTNPRSKYEFRLKTVAAGGAVSAPLTAGIAKSVSWWSPDNLISFSGVLWELQPVELVARNRPVRRTPTLESVEASVFAEEGVSVDSVRQFLSANGLALIVSRNVTTRDLADKQQAFNLRVPGGVQNSPSPGKVYDVVHQQLFQADQIRGYQRITPGRRPLATPMHDGLLMPNAGGPAGSVKIAPDGSTAALVPARRALSWQLTNGAGEPVVRERYWLTFQPGEIRVCSSCHGLNQLDQAGNPTPANKPQALRSLIQFIRGSLGAAQPTSTPTPSITPRSTPTAVPATPTPTVTPTSSPSPRPTSSPTPRSTSTPMPSPTPVATQKPAEYSLAPRKLEYLARETIHFAWTKPVANNSAWAGLYLRGAGNRDYFNRVNLGAGSAGVSSFSAPVKAGWFEIRMFKTNNFISGVLVSKPFLINTVGPAQLKGSFKKITKKKKRPVKSKAAIRRR